MAETYYFGVRWDIDNAPHAIRVNGIPTQFIGEVVSVNSMEPASQFLRTGINTIEMFAWPSAWAPGQTLGLSVVYWARGDDPNTQAQTAFRVSYNPSSTEPGPFYEIDDRIENPVRPIPQSVSFMPSAEFDTFSVSFELAYDLPQWCFDRGDQLRASPELLSELTAIHKDIHGLLAAGRNNEAIDKWYGPKIAESAQAYDEPVGYVRQRSNWGVFMKNPDIFQLMPFPDQQLTLNFGNDNRVVWLTERGVTPPIQFAHTDTPGIVSASPAYMVRENGVWQVCR